MPYTNLCPPVGVVEYPVREPRASLEQIFEQIVLVVSKDRDT
jgi:hypothetical protein